MTKFRYGVKIGLMRAGKNQQWLCREVNRRTGLYIDSAYMSRIIAGERNPPRILYAICEILAELGYPLSREAMLREGE